MNNRSFPMEELYPFIADMLEKDGKAIINVSGVSMQPLMYHLRDTVTLVKPNFPLKKYDIPFYRRDDGKFILHRIIKVHHDGSYTCRGDNQWEKEYPVYDNQIIGVVTSVERNGKHIDIEKSFGYFLYIRTWGVLHHFKHLYRYWRYFKISINRRKNEIFHPVRTAFTKEDGSVQQIIYRYARKNEVKKIQNLVNKLAQFEVDVLKSEVSNPSWAYSPDAKNTFECNIENHFQYVALCGNEIIGCISGRITKRVSDSVPIATCGNIYVGEEFRGAGVATKMLDIFKDYCRENGCKHIRISVKKGNENAERLYRKNGFDDCSKTLLCKLDEE